MFSCEFHEFFQNTFSARLLLVLVILQDESLTNDCSWRMYCSSIMKWKFSIDKKNEDIWSSKYVSFTASKSGRDISKNEILPKAHIFRLNCLENLIWKVSPWAVPAFKSGWVKIYNCFIPKFQYNVLPYSSLYGIF